MPGYVAYTKPYGTKVAVLTLENPPVQSLSNQIRTGLHEGIKRANNDSSVRAIIITGGNKTFPAGADISEFTNPALLRIHPLPGTRTPATVNMCFWLLLWLAVTAPFSWRSCGDAHAPPLSPSPPSCRSN